MFVMRVPGWAVPIAARRKAISGLRPGGARRTAEVATVHDSSQARGRRIAAWDALNEIFGGGGGSGGSGGGSGGGNRKTKSE